ncbi:MAG: class I SAM-dependent methyltransferase [Dehalococcoidales bacterium]|nr:class I SAM-dependent methyltransferase [Dehalococcoidales bacterium]
MDNRIASVRNGEVMRLGTFEFLAMNNPLRRWSQKNIELRIFQNQLKRNHIDLTGKAVMDGGCGSGYSTELIIKAFNPSRIVAFDYMPEQIRLAKKRNLEVDFFIGDLTRIDSDTAVFDAFFVFGVLHHIPQWKKALSEISRVLKPEGAFLIEEPRERFTWDVFQAGILNSSFKILDVRSILTNYFRFYLCKKEK